MASSKVNVSEQSRPLDELLPKSGLVISEKGSLAEVPCKPKIIPLKSVTLEKIEEMERQVQEALAKQLKEQQAMGLQQQQQGGW